MNSREVGPIGTSSFGGGPSRGWPSSRGGVHGKEGRPRRPALDQVELTEPNRATLLLLRERVLENTRTELGLERDPSVFRFAHHLPASSAADFVGRLLSDQNVLAGQRRSAWPPREIAGALERGTTQGVEETMQILYELEKLDEESWGLVCDVLDEFHRKVLAAHLQDPG